MRRRDVLGGLAAMAAGSAYAGDGPPAAVDPKVKETYDKRAAYWSTIGKVETDVISYIVNPQFMGSPPWPDSRQAYVVVRPPKSLIIASDGLSDFVGTGESARQGFGCEVFLEIPELANATFEEIKTSWVFSALENFAQNVAANEGLSSQLDRYGILSMELPIDNAPASFTHSRGTVGALINMPTPYPAKLSLPAGTVDMIPLTLVTKRELNKIVSGGRDGRSAVAAERSARGTGHKTVLQP
jgi:hypothetical protein